jgi:hypothetical protein
MSNQDRSFWRGELIKKDVPSTPYWSVGGYITYSKKEIAFTSQLYSRSRKDHFDFDFKSYPRSLHVIWAAIRSDKIRSDH